MTPQMVVHVVGESMMAAFWLAAPLLMIAFAVGIFINLVQIAISMQDTVFATVPRLAAFLFGFLLLMPWMLHRATSYAYSIFSDLARYAR